MRLRTLILSLHLLFGSVVLGLPAQAQDAGFPLVTAYSSKEIGTDALSWVAVQDTEGVMHFGCNALVSYDGERWRNSPLKGTYGVRGLDFGRDGKLWAGAVGEIGWFEKATDGTRAFQSLRPKLPTNQAVIGAVWCVLAEGEGAVFVTEDKIYRWDGKAFQIWSLPGARRLTAMRVDGTIYIHHPPTGLYALGPDGPHQIISAEVLGKAQVYWMERRPDGWLLATEDGLRIFSGGRLEPYAPEASELVKHQSLTSALRLPDGRLAIGTYMGGIVLVRPDGTLDRVLDDKNGLPTRTIYSLSLDRSGGLWGTSNSHIFRVAIGSASTLFDSRAGLPAAVASRVMARSEGKLTVATDDGVYELQPDNRTFKPLQGVPKWVSDIQATPGGMLVAGVYAVRKVTKETISEVYRTNNQGAFLLRASRIWPGSLLVAEGRSIVRVDGNQQSRVLVQNLPDMALSVAEDNQGRLWLGTYKHGILVAEPNATNPVEASRPEQIKGLVGPDETGAVVGTPEGNLLIFGANGGWMLDRDTGYFKPIDGYPQRNFISSPAYNPDGAIWMAFTKTETMAACIARITVKGKHAIWEPHTVEGLESLGTLRNILAEPSESGATVLWISGANGILRHVVGNGPVAPQPRPPLLRSFARSADSDALAPITRALPYSTRSIVFEFAEPEFARRAALHLETKIDGIDDRWVPADATSRRELTAVRDGSYAFHVRAVAETGAVSESSSFRFEVTPPWWRTWPAIAGVLLALLPAGYGAYRLKVQALQRYNASLERKVSERTVQLAQASAAKTQFVANMSHDIRNPLNGIVGLALALEDTRLDPKQRELVATLRECTTYLSTLVDDVLDFASIEAGRVELRPGPFTPAELLRSVSATLRAEAAGRGAILMVETDPSLPASLLGDAGRIQQILVNYASNALKYAGGIIRLSATADAQGEIEFSVRDEGAGISEAEQTALFTKFTRLPNAQRGGTTGSGLGLASCRLLADIMGGSVGIESRPGHGARFYLRLPLTVAMAPAAPAGDSVLNASVLVVEDADYNAWAASAVLAKLGLTCERARTGQEAIRMFGEKRFNLVLLDRNLPDMDGTEVARQIRALEEDGPRTILLAVTAYCTPQDRALCLEAGMDAFVGKPLTPAKLRKILIAAGRRLLSAASMHVSPGVPAAAVDVSLLDYISDGTEQGLEDQIERFLAALAEGEARLAQASQAQDFTNLGDAAHYLLSQAKLVGSAPLEEAAVSLERAARCGDGFAFGELRLRVHREIRSVTEAMRRNHPAEQTA